METDMGGIYDKDQVSSIWPEAYLDWVKDWEDTVNKEGFLSTACCSHGLSDKRILWPIDLP
jgi:hypothetical protein